MRRILRSYLDLVRQKDIPPKMTVKQANAIYTECITGGLGHTLKTIAFRFSGVDFRGIMENRSKEADEAVAKHRKLV